MCGLVAAPGHARLTSFFLLAIPGERYLPDVSLLTPGFILIGGRWVTQPPLNQSLTRRIQWVTGQPWGTGSNPACLHQGLSLQSGRVPWPEVEPATFWCMGRQSTTNSHKPGWVAVILKAVFYFSQKLHSIFLYYKIDKWGQHNRMQAILFVFL